MILFLCACDKQPLDTGTLGFHVVGVSPKDGATDVVEAHVPELRLSAPADSAVCTSANIRLVAIHADGTVAFPVDIEVTPIDGGSKLQLAHSLPFFHPWTYAITVVGGADGCLDLDGNAIEAFQSTFEVP